MVSQLTSVYLFALAGAICLKMLWDHSKGRVELLSLRNLALVGLIVFQVTSAALRLWQDRFDPFQVSFPEENGVLFAIWVTIFAALVFVSYKHGWGVKRLARLVPVAKGIPSPGTMLLMALIFVILGAGLRFAAIGQKQFAILADFFGNGYCAMAAGLVGWVWGKRLFNPALVLYGLLIIGLGLAVVMSGAFGRRGIVAIGGGLIWGMYYSVWRYMPVGKMWTRLAIVGVPAALFLAAFTAVRSSAEHDRTTTQHLQAMVRADLLHGFALLLDGQNTGAETIWIMENYPERFAYRPMFTIWYTAGVMVPREIWKSKPDALSNAIATQARLDQINRDRVKLSPGIIGSAAAEGGFLAVLIYAAAFGLFLRFYEEIMSLAPWSPFAVLPVASSLGQILGLARGETAVFANTYILTVLGCWLTMLVIGRAVGAMRGAAAYEVVDDGGESADPYAPWADYGEGNDPDAGAETWDQPAKAV